MYESIKKNKIRGIDAVNAVVLRSIDERSLRPITYLFRKGFYGSRHVLKGNYLTSMKFEEKKRKYPAYTVG